MKQSLLLILALGFVTLGHAEMRVYPDGSAPNDRRLGSLKDLNGHFPFAVPENRQAWETRAEDLRRRVLVANGLWPMPERTPLNAVIHGKTEREGFTVEKVYFESLPGFYVTGLLFRPTGQGEGPFPGVLSPHGHGGRLQDHGVEGIRKYLVTGAERFEASGRFPKVARCAQLARMGCVALLVDMIGYADNQQLSYELAHRFAKQRPEASGPDSWGLYSPQAELRLQSIMGLQSWNAIRALDLLESLPDVDPARLGVTGGSGGGTQTILLGAMDPRPVVAFPQGMVSTSMQGGCTCENTALLRIGTGNVELAALFAPRPQAMTAADDWTEAMMTDGYPQLKQLYQYYDAENAVACHDLTHFPHNYNYVTRALMYAWFNKHLDLGKEEPIVEGDFPPLTAEEHAVWNEDHPQPEGGLAFERQLTKTMAEQSDAQLAALRPTDPDSFAAYRDVVGGAWQTLIGRSVPESSQIHQEAIGLRKFDKHSLSLGKIQLTPHGEEIPVMVCLPEQAPGDDFVLWLHGEGKGALVDAEGNPSAPIRTLLDAGRPVTVVDLFGQGEFVRDSESFDQQRTVENPREYAGYTFGYNDSLFAQRVHDVLTLIGAMAQDAETITVIGTDGAGPWATVAGALAGDSVTKLAVDTEGFRFTEIRDYLDPQFLPGALKYGDLPAALSLCAPQALWVRGETALATVESAYRAAGSPRRLTMAAQGSDEDLVAWVLQ